MPHSFVLPKEVHVTRLGHVGAAVDLPIAPNLRTIRSRELIGLNRFAVGAEFVGLEAEFVVATVDRAAATDGAKAVQVPGVQVQSVGNALLEFGGELWKLGQVGPADHTADGGFFAGFGQSRQAVFHDLAMAAAWFAQKVVRLGGGTIEWQNDASDGVGGFEFVTPGHAVGVELHHHAQLACVRADAFQVAGPQQRFAAAEYDAGITLSRGKTHPAHRFSFIESVEAEVAAAETAGQVALGQEIDGRDPHGAKL